MEQVIENDARGVAGRGLAVGLLELAQDLRLAQNHGVEAGGHAEEVAHGLVVDVAVGVGLEILDLGAPGHGPVAQHLLGHVARAHGEQLHAVAGGEDQRLVDGASQGKGPGVGIRVLDEREALAHVDGGGPVVQADENDIAVHEARSLRKNGGWS